MSKQPLSWVIKEYLGYLVIIVPLVIVGHFVVKFW